MHETTPSDRVQLVGQGELMHPGCCALCGSGNSDDGYVNTGIYYDYEGQVYLCWTCAHQIASVIGCLSAEETSHLQELLSDAAVELASVKADMEKANARLGHYDHLLASITIPGDSGISHVNSDSASVQQAADVTKSELSSGTVKPSDDGKPVVKESVTSSGRRKPSRIERSDASTADSIAI